MFLLDRTVAIYRLSEVAGNKQSYSTLTTTLESTIQPISDGKAAMAGGAYGKMFVAYFDVDRDIVVGDKVLDRNGNWYKVISGGVENRDDGFMADYFKITMQKIN
jgi:hypothetical protein